MDGRGVCRHCFFMQVLCQRESSKKSPFPACFRPRPPSDANDVGRAWRTRARHEKNSGMPHPARGHVSAGRRRWHRKSFTCHNSCMDSSGYLLFPHRGSSGDRASPDTKKGGLSVAFRYRGNVGWNGSAGPRTAWRSVRYWTPRVRSGCRGRSGGSFRVPQR